MKSVATILILLCVSLSCAQADLLCVKNRVKIKNGALRLAPNVKVVTESSCPRGYTLVKDLAPTPDSRIAGFAKVGGDGTVASFGGNNVTSVTVDRPSAGRFDVTFNGSFSLVTDGDSAENRALFTVASSAVADLFGVTNNGVSFASSSQITVSVFLWRSASEVEEFQSGINLILLKAD